MKNILASLKIDTFFFFKYFVTIRTVNHKLPIEYGHWNNIQKENTISSRVIVPFSHIILSQYLRLPEWSCKNIEIKNEINWNGNKFIIPSMLFRSDPTMVWIRLPQILIMHYKGITPENNMINIEICDNKCKIYRFSFSCPWVTIFLHSRELNLKF